MKPCSSPKNSHTFNREIIYKSGIFTAGGAKWKKMKFTNASQFGLDVMMSSGCQGNRVHAGCQGNGVYGGGGEFGGPG